MKKSETGKGKARKSDYVEIDSEKGEDEVGGASDQEHENGESESEAGSDEDREKFPPINQSKNAAPVARLHQILDRYCVSYRRFHQLLILL